MSEHGDMGCGGFAGVAAELSLGVLLGRERAEALAHLEHCEACRETVRQLAVTGEGLLGLLPAAEPPPGFENRVLARIGIGTPAIDAPPAGVPPEETAAVRRRAGRRAMRAGAGRGPGRRMLAVAATVLAVVAGVLGGWGLRDATSPAAPPAASSPLRSAALVTGHRTVGHVYYYAAGQPWMYVSVDLPFSDGTVVCELKGAGGHYTPVGSFRLTGGYGAWGGPYGGSYGGSSGSAGPAGAVDGARLVGANGEVLATASFP